MPKRSITDAVPPKRPAFFNPRARITRDISIVAYAAFVERFEGPKILLEGLSGIGPRGLRAANELEGIEKVVINDLNPSALKIAEYSARLNGLGNVGFSEDEVCRFLGSHAKKGERGSMVDIDPFGSPAPFFDCGIRATMHGGILSTTATDLQVLNGLFQDACKRRYGGTPVRVEYGDEMAIRLILGCLGTTAARLGVTTRPIFVESDMHYYRTYVKILNRPDLQDNMGYIIHCKNCKNRKGVPLQQERQECELCKSRIDVAGPLWIGKIFDREFIKDMLLQVPDLQVDRVCKGTLDKCLEESEMPPTYYTLDEVASRMRGSPPKLEYAIKNLQENGFQASVTSFNPTGFRTDADIDEIIQVFKTLR